MVTGNDGREQILSPPQIPAIYTCPVPNKDPQGICHEDSTEDINWLVRKIAGLRIFNDGDGVMNRSIMESGGDIIVVSQFTLMASTKKGNRPSYIGAAGHEKAIPLYEQFCKALSEAVGKPVGTGEFGADMKVSLVNDGPVTICIDSKNRE